MMRESGDERGGVLDELLSAAQVLAASLDPRLIPPGGATIGFAIRGARDAGGVAALSERITRDSITRRPGIACSFGADADIARAILTAMKFDPLTRSAAILRFSGKVTEMIDALFLDTCTPEQKPFPANVSTMDWRIASCCRDGVPDVICCPGTGEPGPLMYFFGEDAATVSNNIIMLSNRTVNIEL